MRRILLVLTVLLFVPALPAGAQTTTASLDAAAAALRNDPVYVDRSADLAGDIDVGSLRSRIQTGDSPIFVAVLPDVGGDVNQLPTQLAQRVGLRGTYAVVSGRSFRAGSNVLPTGQAGSLATAAFQAQRDNGLGSVLNTFVDRVNQAAAGRPGGGGDVSSDDGGGSSGSGGLLLLLAAGGGGLFVWSRRKAKRRRAEEAKEYEADRQLLQAELSVLGQDVIELEPEVTMNPDARPDYDAGVTRFQSAKAALEYADQQVDLVRVERVIDEGRYSMGRARARIDGREPPAPPENLTRPGRHGEPAIDLDERGEPVYANYGGMPMPYYGGGGWFGGGGSGLLTGLLLGQMLGGGFGGWGGGGYGGGGQDGGGGDSGGDTGGGDWGGGFGGGDFGGGDFGGGGDF